MHEASIVILAGKTNHRARGVNEVKGKSALWFFQLIMLLSALMVNAGTSAASSTKLYIEPNRIPEPGQTGHPGDEYNMSVEVNKVEDLYAVCFTVKFAPYARTLVASNVAEGDFLSQGSYPTFFYYTISAFEGTIKVSITRVGDVPGVSGSGTLMTFKLTVVDAGESPIDLLDDILLDSNGNTIPHATSGSYYYGATATLIRVLVLPSRRVKAGENVTFWSKVRNNDNATLYVRVRFDIERLEDGRRVTFYTGQTYLGGYLGGEPPYTELFCDGYHDVYEFGWNHYGDSPWLDIIEDESLINSTMDGAMTSMYTFEDITLPYLGKYSVIRNVDFYGYTKCTSVESDIDPYCFTTITNETGGIEELEWMWCDSMGGTTDWAWTGCRYYLGQYNFPEYQGFPLTEEAVDNVELLLYNCYGTDGVQCDALKARVEFATVLPETPPVYELGPYEERELGPAIWVTDDGDIGTYACSATIEYSEEYPDPGYHWISGNTKTFTIWIVDP